MPTPPWTRSEAAAVAADNVEEAKIRKRLEQLRWPKEGGFPTQQSQINEHTELTAKFERVVKESKVDLAKRVQKKTGGITETIRKLESKKGRLSR